jgi:hypothetical protein
LDFAAIKEDRNTARLNEAAVLFCGVHLPHRSRVLRECRGNACHTTGLPGVVCYTATPQTAKTKGFHRRLQRWAARERRTSLQALCGVAVFLAVGNKSPFC